MPSPITARRLRRLSLATLVVAGTSCLSGTDVSTNDTPSNPATETYAPSLGVNLSQMTKLSDALYTQDLVAGTGTAAALGKVLSVTYTGWLVNGTQFDSNVGKSAFTFTLGAGQVIPGWDAGLVGMKVGGTRLLVIGSSLGYGPGGAGPIPPDATLVFKVQLTSVQ